MGYEGQWKDGQKEGRGVQTYEKNGCRYDGEWKGGKKQGQGTWSFPDGASWKGVWRGGEPKEGVWILRTGERVPGRGPTPEERDRTAAPAEFVPAKPRAATGAGHRVAPPLAPVLAPPLAPPLAPVPVPAPAAAHETAAWLAAHAPAPVPKAHVPSYGDGGDGGEYDEELIDEFDGKAGSGGGAAAAAAAPTVDKLIGGPKIKEREAMLKSFAESGGGGGASAGAGSSGAGGGWACVACTLVNAAGSAQCGACGGALPHCKFIGDPRTMRDGKPAAAARGIWAALGIKPGSKHGARIQGDGVGEIQWEFSTLGEHCDDKDRERFAYVFEQPAALLEQDNGKKRDIGNEGLTLDDFCKQPDARKAGLTKEHVLALRLYTSNSYGRINDPLRDGIKPHPFAATTYYIHDAIAKLRLTRANDATAVRTFWRGLDDMAVSDDFMAQGGTEIGCMSTTESIDVARKFAKVRGYVEAGEEKANPLLLKVEATSLMVCGADIGWLSMYPEEKEVLFPPLTYLRPMGQPVLEGGCTVVTVQPHF